MLKTRLISGIIIFIIFITALIFGGIWFFLINMLLGCCAMYELYKTFNMKKDLISIIGYVFIIIYYFVLFGYYNGFCNIPDFNFMIICFFLLINFIIYVIKYPYIKVINVIKSLFVFIYGGVFISYLYRIRSSYMGIFLILLIILSSWGCDSLAYCVGIKFGNKKLCSNLSCKKSVEGAFGGIIGAGLLGSLYGVVMVCIINCSLYIILKFSIICIVNGIFSQFGDLFASGIKREHGIKDYSELIPGHGGIMDRFDSVIFILPIVFYLRFYII